MIYVIIIDKETRRSEYEVRRVNFRIVDYRSYAVTDSETRSIYIIVIVIDMCMFLSQSLYVVIIMIIIFVYLPYSTNFLMFRSC